MTRDQGIYRIETYSWMQPVTPVNDPKRVYYTIGEMLDFKHKTIAVSRAVSGGTMFYCPEHNMVFDLKQEECPICRDGEPTPLADAQQEAAVTPL